MSVKERLETTKARLESYYAAELAILSGQRYKIGTRELERANIAEVSQTIKILENKVDELQSELLGKGRRKVFRVTPRDL